MARRAETVLPTDSPYVAPGVDPSKIGPVEAYRDGILSRRGGGVLPKADLPLHPERPLIPLLSGGPSPGQRGGATMADYAQAERSPQPAAFGRAPQTAMGSIITEAPSSAIPPPLQASQPRPTAASLGLFPADLLPPAAREDPDFIQGHGSEIAANQPFLASKYGVLRNGTWIPPQQLNGGGQRSTLRPETVENLETLRKLQETQAAGLDPNEAASRKVVENGLGGSAARVGTPGDPATPAPTEEERAKVLRQAIDRMDAFEFNQWRQLTMREMLHSEGQRTIIESRLAPLDIGELLMNGVIRQRIPIIPGKYEITLQNYDGQVEMAIKRMVMSESRSVDASEQYLLDKHSFMTLAVGLYKVCDRVFPDILDAQGVFNDDLFLKKFNLVMKLPIHMLASIGVNQMWFEMRVRKLYTASAVGNG